MLSKNTSQELWFIMVRIGRMVRPLPSTVRMSTMKVDSPSVFFATWSRGVVRASSSIRSECSAREVQIFWPLTMYLSPSLRATVRSAVVSVPLVGSVTPKACSRSSPLAIFGRYSAFCRSLPCRRMVPMMYICAWQAAPLQPWRCTSSRIAAAAESGRPEPPNSSGISAASQPASVSACTNSVG